MPRDAVYCSLCDKQCKDVKRVLHKSVQEILLIVGIELYTSPRHDRVCTKCHYKIQVILQYVKDGKTDLLKIFRSPKYHRNTRKREQVITIFHGVTKNSVPGDIWKEALKISLSKDSVNNILESTIKDNTKLFFSVEEEVIDWSDTFIRYQGSDDGEPSTWKVLRVCTSSVHGYGVFAQEDINVGEYVIEYTGRRLSITAADALEERYHQHNMFRSYMFKTCDNYIIDATQKGSIARFVNHSCNPNIEARHVFDREKHRVYYYALKKIPKRGELFTSYEFNEDENHENALCNCGSSKCKKVKF